MILIVLGIEKIQVSVYSKEYEAMFKMDGDKLNQLGVSSIGELMMDTFWWSFGAFLVVFVLIGTFKLSGKLKKGLLDTLLAFTIVFALFPLGFFNSGVTHQIVNHIGDVFSDELRTRMLITGLFWTVLGIAIIWFTLKNTKHNKVHNSKQWNSKR